MEWLFKKEEPDAMNDFPLGPLARSGIFFPLLGRSRGIRRPGAYVAWILGLGLVLRVASSMTPLSGQSGSDYEIRNHFQSAREAERSGDLDKAAKEYLAVLKYRPDESIVLNNLGLVYLMQGKNHAAIDTLQKAVTRDSTLLGARLFLGIAYYRISRMEHAVTHLSQAAAMSSQNLQARLYLGRALQVLGQNEDALKELRAAEQIAPENADVLYSLGQVYGKLMAEAYAKMVQENPDSYRVHQVLAESYRAQKNEDKAILEYKAAIKKAPPQTPGLHYGLGDVLWRVGRYPDAEAEFREELKILPDDPLANWKIGNILLFQNRWEDALPYLEKAVEIQPDLAQAYRDLGKAYLQTNKPEKAIVALNKVAELAPEEDTVHYRLANIYRKLGRKAEAEAEMKLFETLNKKAQAIRNPLLPQVTPEEQE